jgi:hypothetical protein
MASSFRTYGRLHTRIDEPVCLPTPHAGHRTLTIYGRERAALVFGWVFAGHQLGAAVAAIGGGLSRDLLASYVPAFMTSGAICLLAAVAALGLRAVPPSRREPAGGGTAVAA